MLARPALTLVVCVLALNCAMAQQFGFTQFSPRDGLAQSQVRCMVQDKAGYLWFGTLGGASRFDGLEFVNYGLRDGLPDPQVNAMLA
ncbi:MAG: two-component regulator propeller domain-containing protein, partial [Flavobacteriales bacterium]